MNQPGQSGPKSSIKKIWGELRRRRVVGTAAAYVVGAWLIVEISATVFPALLLPEWTVRFITVLMILGFPITLLLSWFFDIHWNSRTTDATSEVQAVEGPDQFADSHLPLEKTEEASVAVIPFDNLSPDPEHRFLADAIAMELHRTLSRMHRLRVISRKSSFSLGESAGNVRDIGRALSAQYIVSGSVVCDHNRIRIIVEVDNASDGTQLWAESYERDMGDLLETQKSIAEQVVRSFSGVRLSAEIRAAVSASPNDLSAWRLVQRARSYLLDFSPQVLDEAIDQLREALQLDPDYASAHAALAVTLGERALNAYSEDFEADKQAAVEAASMSIRLSPDDPFVLKDSGVTFAFFGYLDRSLESLRRATRLAPFDLGAWGYLGWPLTATGQRADLLEVERIMERLLEDSPEHPGAPFWLFHLSVAKSCRGEHEHAVEHGTASVDLNSRFPLGQMHLANELACVGLDAESRNALERCRQMSPRMTVDHYLSVIRGLCAEESTASRRTEGLTAL